MHLKERIAKEEKSKERLTVMVAANMDESEKLPLMVIGKSKKPRCFKYVKSLPVQYEANKKAWMTGDLYTSWLWKLDRAFQKEKWKVLLFADNCLAHPIVPRLQAVTVHFLPPNTTAVLQPMDQGVIQCFKMWYKKLLLGKMVEAIDSGSDYKADVLEAMKVTAKAWEHVSGYCIANCFRHAGRVTGRALKRLNCQK